MFGEDFLFASYIAPSCFHFFHGSKLYMSSLSPLLGGINPTHEDLIKDLTSLLHWGLSFNIQIFRGTQTFGSHKHLSNSMIKNHSLILQFEHFCILIISTPLVALTTTSVIYKQLWYIYSLSLSTSDISLCPVNLTSKCTYSYSYLSPALLKQPHLISLTLLLLEFCPFFLHCSEWNKYVV